MATYNSINSNVQGNNTFLGSGSGNITLTGDFNIGLGSETLNSLTTGLENVGIGYNSLTAVTTGANNVTLGNVTGTLITTGSQNTIVGSGSGAFLVSGNNNILLGYLNGSNYTTNESDNIIIATGFSGTGAESHKIYIGVDGGGANQQDACFTAGALTSARGITATTGNIGITAGNLALPNTNAAGTQGEITLGGNRWISNFGTANIFVGDGSGNTTLTTADNNVGVGLSSLNSLTTADRSVAIGSQAGRFITTAANCVGVGYKALQGNSIGVPLTGIGNTAIGFQSGIEIGAGTYNILLGYGSAFQLTSGSYNILMGINAPTIASGSSNILIHGTAAAAAESNIIRIGTTGAGFGQQNKCFIAGTTGVTPDVAGAKLMLIDTSGQVGSLGAATNGQIAIGSTGANPILAAITAGAGINVTNGAGSIAIAAVGSGLVTWTTETINMNAVVNEGYVANKAGTLEFLLPAAAAVGSTIRITGINTATGWKVTQNAGQTIFFGALTSTPGVAGFIASTAIRDSVELVCVVTDTDWNVVSAVGNITVS